MAVLLRLFSRGLNSYNVFGAGINIGRVMAAL